MSEQIKRLLKQLTDQPHPVVTGTVTGVDLADLTCEVQPDDGGAELVAVRLRPVLDEEDNGLLIVPAVGSAVAVLMLDADTPLLISTSAVQLYSVRTKQESLKEILGDLMEALEVLTVSTPAGPSNPAGPNNRASFAALKARLNSLFHS